MEMVDLTEEPDEALLDEVASGLYLDSFPIAEEREDPARWKDALWHSDREKENPVLRGVVAGMDLRLPSRDIWGFVFFELYRRSRCGLISYIAVDPDQRRLHLGRDLVAHAVKTLQRDAAASGAPLEAVFAEIHDPEKVPPAADSMDAAERVSFFAKLHARKVPIRYVQPELEEGAGPALSLDLVALPLEGAAVHSLQASTVRTFLQEYSEAAQQTAETEESLRLMLDQLKGETVELEPLNQRLEQPAVAFRARFSIGFHFVTVGDPVESVPPAKEQFASFERDLLAYSFRDRPPFSSSAVHVDKAWRIVKLETAPELRYVSEGRMATLVAEEKSSAPVLQVRGSKTTFISGVTVSHLVLTPSAEAAGVALTEYDVVKLVKLWEGGEDVDGPYKGEGIERCVRFRGRSGEVRTIRELAADVFSDPRLAREPPRAGTVQLLTPESAWAPVWEAARDVGAYAEAKPGQWQLVRRAVEGIAGIVQGIVDFEEIDVDELQDVFAGVTVDSDGLRGLHKGTLITIGNEDRALEVGFRSYGVSPYLLIPHAVLLHNEEQLRRAAAAAASAESRRFRDLEAAKTTMHEALNRAFLPNVFHYKSERDLYREGHDTRGLTLREESLRMRLTEVNSDYDVKNNTRRGIADDVRNALLLVLSFTSYSAAFSPSRHRNLFVALGLVAISVVYLAWRWVPPSTWMIFARRRDRARARST
jgi:GNAT superfamily N-acetyltransferase